MLTKKHFKQIADLIINLETDYFKDTNDMKSYIRNELRLFCEGNSKKSFHSRLFRNYIDTRVNNIKSI